MNGNPVAITLQLVQFATIPGWLADNHQEAFESFKRSFVEILQTGHGFKRPVLYGGHREDWLALEKQLENSKNPRQFFENNFLAFKVCDETNGLFTGYYEPQAAGSRTSSSEYPAAIYRKPGDLINFKREAQEKTGLNYGRLVNGKPSPYLTRKEIEQGGLREQNLEIVWLQSWEDAFFIHIQGSGRVLFEDGSTMRLAYAAKSGLPYTGIGSELVRRGALTAAANSMQSIRQWMRANADLARELMWCNKSFVFFREIVVANSTLGAIGAQQVHLTPHRSLAIDRSLWMFGTPVWLNTKLPPEGPQGAMPFQKLMIAQDTGSAIKGAARGDVYWGWGETAAQIAGHMKSHGTMYVLLPHAVAKRAGLVP